MKRRACTAALVFMAAGASVPAVQPPDEPAQQAEIVERAEPSPRAVADYEALLAVYRANARRYYCQLLIGPAAASREDVRAVALDRLARGEGDEKALHYALYVISSRWDGAAVAAMDRAMGDASLPRLVRSGAERDLESMLGNDYLDPDAHPGYYKPDDRPIDERVASLREAMKKRPPLIDGRHLALLEKNVFRRGEAFLVKCAEPDADEHCLENSELLLYGYEWLDFGGSEREQAVLLVEHLGRLRALPRGMDDGRYDRVVGNMQRDAMWRMQEYAGPVEIMMNKIKDRDEIDTVLDGFLAWWEGVKDKQPVDWRMEHLAKRGYRVGKAEDARLVSAELLRAIRSGTPGEARGAADVLEALGLDCGAVPLPKQWDPEPSVDTAALEVVHGFVRGMVSARAAELMMEKGWPRWSEASGKWELVPPS